MEYRYCSGNNNTACLALRQSFLSKVFNGQRTSRHSLRALVFENSYTVAVYRGRLANIGSTRHIARSIPTYLPRRWESLVNRGVTPKAHLHGTGTEVSRSLASVSIQNIPLFISHRMTVKCDTEKRDESVRSWTVGSNIDNAIAPCLRRGLHLSTEFVIRVRNSSTSWITADT